MLRLMRYGFVVGAVLLTVWAVLVVTLVLTYRTDASDWTIFFDAAVAFRVWPHMNFWNDATTMAASRLPGACPIWPHESYKYPPLLLIILYPLTFLPCVTATLIWRIIMLALWGWVAVVVAAPLWRVGQRGWALAAVALIATYPPLIDGMILGQDHILTLALMVAGIAFAVSGKQWVAGGALAIGFWIKYTPAILALYYLLTGRWRVAMSAALLGLALLLAQLALVGPTAMLESLNPAEGIDVDPVWSGWPGGKLWGYLAVVVFIGGVLLARWRFRASDDALGVGWALCTLLFFSPAIRWYYLTWLLPAFWACLVEVMRVGRSGAHIGWRQGLAWTPLVALALIFAVSLVPYNPITMSVSIVALWLLNGGLYLRRAWVSPMRVAGGFLSLRDERPGD